MSLLEIQQRLVGKKNMKNDFGGYSYRSAEGILEALKPHLLNYEYTLIFNDEIHNIGERYYNICRAELRDKDSKTIIRCQGVAREPIMVKGQGEQQISGACSSYSKKYALQNMFAIDDSSVDPDATNNHKKEAVITADQVKLMYTTGTKAGIDKGSFRALLRRYGYGSAKQVEVSKFEAILAEVEKFA